MACRFLCIPASSVPVERLFSIAGKVLCPDRCHLTDKQFEEYRMTTNIGETNIWRFVINLQLAKF